MFFRKINFFFILILLTVNQAFTQSVSDKKARKYSNEFLAIGVGARALGMSNASITTVNDVTAGYWNPAGLLEMEGNLSVGLMHSEYFAGIAKYDYGAIATPIDSNSALGFSFIRFGVDNIPNTTELIDAEGNVDYNRITTFSAADYAFLLSYARKMNIPGLRIGANVKVIHRRAGDFAKSWGFGLDAAAKYDYKKWKFAAVARDVTTTYNAWSFDLSDEMKATLLRENNELPENSVEITMPRLIIGIAREEVIKEKIYILAEFDADFTFDGKRNVVVSGDPVSIDPHVGVEISYDKIVFLRGGVGNIQKVKSDVGSRNVTTFQPNFGVGLNIKPLNLTIDYAFTDIGDQSVALYSHVFSLKFNLHKQPL
ncbi:MAG: PorV/PorQ family protein [Flavobacteriales bacterium]|nr:PorV/PorQ family protein [Flavobacteriales bacterium]